MLSEGCAFAGFEQGHRLRLIYLCGGLDGAGLLLLLRCWVTLDHFGETKEEEFHPSMKTSCFYLQKKKNRVEQCSWEEELCGINNLLRWLGNFFSGFFFWEFF